MSRASSFFMLLAFVFAAMQSLPAQTPQQPPTASSTKQSTRAHRPQQDNPPDLSQERRIALVIGNGTYKDAPLCAVPPMISRSPGPPAAWRGTSSLDLALHRSLLPQCTMYIRTNLSHVGTHLIVGT